MWAVFRPFHSVQLSCLSRYSTAILKNEAIKFPKIRLILQDGTNKGEVSLQEARSLYNPSTHNLVLVNSKTPLPVCKIVSKKEEYEKKKKVVEPRQPPPDPNHSQLTPLKQRHASQLKEIEVKAAISKHDLDVKLKKAIELLGKGYRVQVVVVAASRKNVDNVTLPMTTLMKSVTDCLIPEYAKEAKTQVLRYKSVITFTPKI